MNIIKIETIKTFFGEDIQILNEENFISIKNVKPILSADQESLVFIDVKAKNKPSLVSQTRAKVVVCDFVPEDKESYKDKCLIVTVNPKLLFARIINNASKSNFKSSIHPSAVIHPEAKISQDCFIGPYCIIGKCEIGPHTVLHGNCTLYDGVRVGSNVSIDSGAVIGATGFGFVREDDGTPVPFPQLGGVVIGDYVEVGANACIDRGALQDTVIGDHTKIDNLVHISHNDVIGKNNYIIAGCVVAGSVTIGDNCWIAASRILNKVHIGDNVTVGFGALVLNNIKSNKTYMGVPSMDVEAYSKLQYKLQKMIKS
ncbi:MAG: UDP-3-O-(3-hydroxymyristoyl)glucosamine N-acyltransferase [Bacteroidota bacterium]|nr:UDP-3-O-(3-hydroxymyristoyl)glucosamine N-acyltransferase [Bacteroidota bacterium]